VASRADPAPGPRASLAGAVRLAATDLYFNSWRFVPANLVWGAIAVTLIIAIAVLPPALLLAPLLALPTVGLFRMAALVVREEAVSFWDGLSAWRTYLVPSLALGAMIAGTGLVLGVNSVAGILSTSVLGWALATLAGWGLVTTWLFAWTVWPILVDPARADRPAVDRVRTAALLLLAAPLRLLGLGILLLVLTIASTFLIVTVVTVSIGFGALIAARFVLPAADRLDARLGRPVRWEPLATRSTAASDTTDAPSAGAAIGS
jgi:hypothetical protein